LAVVCDAAVAPWPNKVKLGPGRGHCVSNIASWEIPKQWQLRWNRNHHQKMRDVPLPCLITSDYRRLIRSINQWPDIHTNIYIHTYTYTHIHTYIFIHTDTHTLPYITLHYLTLPYITLHYVTLHCIGLHCIALHSKAKHSIA
jgi:hypothetical protein